MPNRTKRSSSEGSVPNRQQGRIDRSKEKVLRTTVEVLYDSGLNVTIDEVARRSGVAKTTIYRHWPTRLALVLDACSQFTPEPSIPNTHSFSEDVQEFVENLAGKLESARWTGILPAIVDAAERSEEVAKVLSAIQVGHAAPIRAIVENAKRRGEVHVDVDASSVAAGIMGPLFYRRWFSREPLSKEFLHDLVRQVSKLTNA